MTRARSRGILPRGATCARWLVAALTAIVVLGAASTARADEYSYPAGLRYVTRYAPIEAPPGTRIRALRPSVRGTYTAPAIASAANALTWHAVATGNDACCPPGPGDCICTPIPAVAGVPLVGPWLALTRPRTPLSIEGIEGMVVSGVVQDAMAIVTVISLLIRHPRFEVTLPANSGDAPFARSSMAPPPFAWALVPNGAGISFVAGF